MPLDNRVTEMLARESIRDVIATYCRCLDESDIEGLTQCFWPEAVADYGPGRGGPISGRAQIAARITHGQRVFRRTHHQLGQISISFQGDRAQALSYATAWHEQAQGTQEVVCLRYIDLLEQKGGDWKIASRRVEAAFVQGFPNTEWNWVRRDDRST